MALSQEKVIITKFWIESEEYMYIYGQQKTDSTDIEYSPILVYRVTEETKEIPMSVEFEGSTGRMLIEIGDRKLPKEFYETGVVYYNDGFQVLLSDPNWVSFLQSGKESDFQKRVQHLLRLQITHTHNGSVAKPEYD